MALVNPLRRPLVVRQIAVWGVEVARRCHPLLAVRLGQKMYRLSLSERAATFAHAPPQCSTNRSLCSNSKPVAIPKWPSPSAAAPMHELIRLTIGDLLKATRRPTPALPCRLMPDASDSMGHPGALDRLQFASRFLGASTRTSLERSLFTALDLDREFAAIALGIWRRVAYRVAIPVSNVWFVIGLCVLVFGLTLRWYSVYYLGRYFTTTVSIAADHHLIETGPYRFIRHPSYAGALLAVSALL